MWFQLKSALPELYWNYSFPFTSQPTCQAWAGHEGEPLRRILRPDRATLGADSLDCTHSWNHIPSCWQPLLYEDWQYLQGHWLSSPATLEDLAQRWEHWCVMWAWPCHKISQEHRRQLSEKDNAFGLWWEISGHAVLYLFDSLFFLTFSGSKSLIPNFGKRQHQSGAEVTKHDVWAYSDYNWKWNSRGLEKEKKTFLARGQTRHLR